MQGASAGGERSRARAEAWGGATRGVEEGLSFLLLEHRKVHLPSGSNTALGETKAQSTAGALLLPAPVCSLSHVAQLPHWPEEFLLMEGVKGRSSPVYQAHG